MQFKAILTVLLAFVLPMLAIAQETTIDKIADETCACMTQKELTNMEQDMFEQELGMCMLTAATPMMAKLQEEENIDMNDPNAFQQIGEKVGAKIAVSCPALFQKMMEFYGSETTTEVRQLLVEEGTFNGLKQGDFARLQLNQANGRTLEFMWMEAFEGSDQLENNPDALKGKNVKIFYLEKSFYDPAEKAYKRKKVIQKIEVN